MSQASKNVGTFLDAIWQRTEKPELFLKFCDLYGICADVPKRANIGLNGKCSGDAACGGMRLGQKPEFGELCHGVANGSRRR